MEILIWQAVVFTTIYLSGRRRWWASVAWVIWTVVQVYTLPLSVIQFGTIALGHWAAGSRARRREAKSPDIQQIVQLVIAREEERVRQARKHQVAPYVRNETPETVFGVISVVLLFLAWAADGETSRMLTGAFLASLCCSMVAMARHMFR